MKRILLFFLFTLIGWSSASSAVYTVSVNSNGAVVFPSNFWIVGLQTGLFSGGTISNSVIKNSFITNSQIGTLEINLTNRVLIGTWTANGGFQVLGILTSTNAQISGGQISSLTLLSADNGTFNNIIVGGVDNTNHQIILQAEAPNDATLKVLNDESLGLNLKFNGAGGYTQVSSDSPYPLRLLSPAGGLFSGSWTNGTNKIFDSDGLAIIAGSNLTRTLTADGVQLDVSLNNANIDSDHRYLLGDWTISQQPYSDDENAIKVFLSSGTEDQPRGFYFRNAAANAAKIQHQGNVAFNIETFDSTPINIIPSSGMAAVKGSLQVTNEIYAKRYSGDGAGLTNFPTTNSVVNLNGKLQLLNDSSSPGTNKYYGTDSSGAKGFFGLGQWKAVAGGVYTWTNTGSVFEESTGVPGILTTDIIVASVKEQNNEEYISMVAITGDGVILFKLGGNAGVVTDTKIYYVVFRPQ